MKEGKGNVFQKETKYFRGKLSGGYLNWQRRPEPYKTYPSSLKIKLDPPLEKGGMPLWEAIKKRRSVRDFREIAMMKSELSQLIWASQGITRKYAGYDLRATPSAGALYPVETYLVILNIEGIEPGIYHYDVRNHELEELQRGDFRSQIAEASLDQDFLSQGAVVFVWTAVFDRSKWKYGERAYRYVYLDAGHIAQNLALASVSLGFGTCQIGALYDDEVNSLLDVEGSEESVLYMTVVGRP